MRFQQPAPSRPPAPARLPAPPPTLAADAPKELPLAETGTVTLTVLLSGAAASERAGLATFHTLTGGDFRWHPLRESSVRADGTRAYEITARCGTPLTLSYAAERAHARHGYIDRVTRDALAAPGGPANSVTMSAATYPVSLRLAEGLERTDPLRLRRVDDQQWLPMQQATSGIELRPGTPAKLQLGAGTYELQAPLAPDQRQTFTVPGAETVDVTLGSAPAQSDRR
ncbi:MAG: hypothetical protein VYD05_07710 [Planctomycetota bacterium]|nr:hypothetical protein [Planctomycetota bacterium]